MLVQIPEKAPLWERLATVFQGFRMVLFSILVVLVYVQDLINWDSVSALVSLGIIEELVNWHVIASVSGVGFLCLGISEMLGFLLFENYSSYSFPPALFLLSSLEALAGWLLIGFSGFTAFNVGTFGINLYVVGVIAGISSGFAAIDRRNWN